MAVAKDKNFTIAVMTGDTQSDRSDEMMRGFYVSAQEEGANIVLLTGPQMPSYCTDIMTSSITGNYRYQFDSIYQYIHFIKPDAAVITSESLSVFNSEQERRSFLEQFADIPYLVVDDKLADGRVPHFETDNYGGMKSCVEHLITDHGYNNIAFLSGPYGNVDSEERARAYRDTMKAHGIQVTNTMVAYGDNTDRVDNVVSYLMDNNPGLQAIVCANDAMCKACYRVCTARNLIVGSDIAITGYDDTSTAASMNPPLTSVSPNSFNIGYTAFKAAVSMCRGEAIESGKMPTMLKKRCSCGCSPMGSLSGRYISEEEMESYVKNTTQEMADYLFSSVSYEKERQYLTDALSEFFNYIYETILQNHHDEFSMDYLLDILRKIGDYPHVSNDNVLEYVIQMLQILMANAQDILSQRELSSVISSTQQFIHALNIEKLEKEIYMSNRKSWFVPAFTRDLASEAYMSRPQDIFYRIMEELEKMGVRSVYFFTFDEPVEHTMGETIDFPETMSLVSFFNSSNLRFFYKVEQPKFSTKEGLMSYVATDKPACLTSAILFSEHRQYGVMLCEVDLEEIPFLQICSMQLGTLFHVIELSLKEQESRSKLQESLEVIKEQNKVLGFLSEYDELTKLMNRRGFIEKAMSLYRENEGKHAYLIFGDLDHLKEINDVFGHAEGDFAIKNVAERFLTILPEEAICGRIGGDEYVAFLLTEEQNFQERIKEQFAKVGHDFNEASDKPYYVEVSLGICECICSKEVHFDTLLKKSDELLYVAKAIRRKSVKKNLS